MIVIIISSLFDDVTDLGSIYFLKLSLFFVSINAMSTLNEILIETSKERTRYYFKWPWKLPYLDFEVFLDTVNIFALRI